MKASEIKDMTASELQEKLGELKQELFNLRFQHAVNQLDNPMRMTVSYTHLTLPTIYSV